MHEDWSKDLGKEDMQDTQWNTSSLDEMNDCTFFKHLTMFCDSSWKFLGTSKILTFLWVSVETYLSTSWGGCILTGDTFTS
jgi:hypothetical protein